LNPTIKVEFWNQRLTPDNAKEIFSDYEIVVDGTDNIPTRYLIDDMCRINSIPWVYGSIYRFEGQVSLFNYNNGPCYRDLFPEPPPSNSIPSCEEGGVFGVLPGVIGSIQATEVLKIIIGNGETLSGRLLLYDAESMDFRTLKYAKNPATPKVDITQVRAMFEKNGWCKNAVAGKGEIQEPINTGGDMFKHLSMTEYKGKKESGWQPFLLDVRSDMEYSQMRISFTDLQVNHEDILSKVDSIPKDIDVILLCRSGMRSQMAAMYLMNAGYDGNKLYNLDGGIMAWNSALPADVE
jgi:adenylyltransferase/sulfurtransferase